MMQLIRPPEFSPAAREVLQLTSSDKATKELLANTFGFFEIYRGEEVIAAGGVVSRDWISPVVYLWMGLKPQEYSRGDLRQGLRLAREYIKTLEWEVRAEIDPENKINQAFAIAVGFEHLADLGDRKLMKWNG